MTTRLKTAFAFACGLTPLVLFADPGFAQARARFSFEGVANCQRPALTNYPIRVDGTGTLSTDRSARLDVDSNIEGRTNYNATLGGKPIDVPAGTASLRVTGRSGLRATRDYPNNVLVIDLKLVGNRCQLKVENRLKPGRSQYTFQTSFGLAYCSKPRVVSTSCSQI